MTIDFASLEIFPAGQSVAAPMVASAHATRKPALAQIFAAIGVGFTRLADKIAANAERRLVMEELSRLSDRELADIGLTRGELAMVFDPVFAAQREAARTARCLGLRAV